MGDVPAFVSERPSPRKRFYPTVQKGGHLPPSSGRFRWGKLEQPQLIAHQVPFEPRQLEPALGFGQRVLVRL